MTDISLQEACEAIGRDTIIKLAQELTTAERKYPVFANSHTVAAGAVKAEMLEWEAKALSAEMSSRNFEKRRDKAEAEGWHVITTMIRYIRREYYGYR